MNIQLLLTLLACHRRRRPHLLVAVALLLRLMLLLALLPRLGVRSLVAVDLGLLLRRAGPRRRPARRARSAPPPAASASHCSPPRCRRPGSSPRWRRPEPGRAVSPAAGRSPPLARSRAQQGVATGGRWRCCPGLHASAIVAAVVHGFRARGSGSCGSERGIAEMEQRRTTRSELSPDPRSTSLRCRLAR